jgi:beta-lactamase regulating signal transducer with metallopeptidase domain
VSGLIVGLLLRPAAVIVIAAAWTALLRHHSAATRHAVWTGAIVATLALPLLNKLLPRIAVETTVADQVVAAVSPRRPSPPLAAVSPAAVAPRRPFDFARAIWITGMLVLLGRRSAAEIQLRGIVRRARLWRRDGGVPLLLTDEVVTPASAGLLRPVLLLPPAAAHWPPADLRAVLEHELSHVRRADHLINALADLARAVYWCNPLLHVAARRLRAESEIACDDRVVAAGADAVHYAHLLLEMARRARATALLPGAATAFARPAELESRLLSVLDPRVPRAPAHRWITTALASVALLTALPAAALELRAAVPGEPDLQGDALADPQSERLPLSPGAYRLSDAARAALAGPDSALARVLAAALDHEPEHAADLVRERAAWALSRARGGELITPLLAALDDRDWRVQAYAAWTLGVAREPRAVPRLIALLEHKVWRLRAMAAAALRETGDPRAIAAMRAALADPAWQVRSEAVAYLVQLGQLTDAERGVLLEDRHIAVRSALQSH